MAHVNAVALTVEFNDIMTPKIRAHRVLKGMSRYVSSDAMIESELHELSETLNVCLGHSNLATIIGVYYTHDKSLPSRIIVLTQEIIFEINQICFPITYSSIVTVDVIHEDKRNIKGIVITTTDEREYFIAIQSNENGTSDAFEILRFFMRVLDYIKKDNLKA